jgi:hypothetical protein
MIACAVRATLHGNGGLPATPIVGLALALRAFWINSAIALAATVIFWLSPMSPNNMLIRVG